MVDASDQTVVGTLTDGDSLALDDPDNGRYGIRADLKSGEEIGSARLELTGAKNVAQTENIAPYSLYGDDADGLNGESLPAGEYTLTATAYAERGLGGTVLGTLAVSFTVTGPAPEEEDQNNPATGAPTISGTAQVDETLTAETSDISDADGLNNPSFAYQWVGNDADISGATKSTYTLVDADEGRTIKVRVSFTDGAGNPESLTSAPTAPVAPAPEETDISIPIWSGTLTVGAFNTTPTFGHTGVLNPNVGSLCPNSFVLDGTTYTVGIVESGEDYLTNLGVDQELPMAFALEVDGVLLESSDASSATYTYAYLYTWSGTGTDWRVGRELPVSLVAREPVQNAPRTGTPSICGTAEVGQTLTAHTLGNAAFSYQWVGNDGTAETDIAGATGSSYALARADEGKTFKVRVSFTDGDGNSQSLTSGPTAVVAPKPNTPSTGAPTISGVAQVGQTLTADKSGISDADGLGGAVFSYQWARGDGTTDTNIAGATGSSYTLVEADEDKTITVRVSFTDDWDNAESQTSEATTTVVDALTPANLSVEVQEDGFLVTWVAPSEDAESITGYRVQRTLVNTEDGNKHLFLVTVPGASTTELLDHGSGEAGTYTYEVSALRDGEPPATSTVQLVIQHLASDHLDSDFMHVVESVCTRTAQVRDAIVAAVSGVSDCADITSEHLRSITSLDLSGQGITTLRDTDFANLDLVKTLDLSGNSLTSIPTDGRFYGVSSFHQSGTRGPLTFFRGYAPLKTLDLSDNQITSLPDRGFYWLIKLENLDLSGNSLTRLPEGAFEQRFFSRLRVLDLSSNDLSSISAYLNTGTSYKGTFDTTRELQKLDLSDNDLTNLARGTFHGPIELQGWKADWEYITWTLNDGRTARGWYPVRVYKVPGLKTLDLSGNGMVTAPREIWDGDCNSQVPNLTIYPGNPVRTCAGAQVWSATMTVGVHYATPESIGWDGDADIYEGDALTDADFEYESETYEVLLIAIPFGNPPILIITFDDVNYGSIDDEDVRKVMTLYIDGEIFPLKDVTSYVENSMGHHVLRWSDPGLTWAADDTVELEIRVK